MITIVNLSCKNLENLHVDVFEVIVSFLDIKTFRNLLEVSKAINKKATFSQILPSSQLLSEKIGYPTIFWKPIPTEVQRIFLNLLKKVNVLSKKYFIPFDELDKDFKSALCIFAEFLKQPPNKQVLYLESLPADSYHNLIILFKDVETAQLLIKNNIKPNITILPIRA